MKARLSVAVAAGSLMLAVVAVAATGTLQGEDQIINACRTNVGMLRMVDDPTDCRRNETLVSWNVQGPKGATGVSGYVRVTATTEASAADGKVASAECPPGTRVLGGGAIVGSPLGSHQQGVYLQDSFPAFDREAWLVTAYESAETGAVWLLQAHAICAEVAP